MAAAPSPRPRKQAGFAFPIAPFSLTPSTEIRGNRGLSDDDGAKSMPISAPTGQIQGNSKTESKKTY